MKTLVAAPGVLACPPAARAQTPVSVRRLFKEAAFVGIIQASPMVNDPNGEWKQGVFLTDAEGIKGGLSRDFGNNQYPWIKANHAGIAGYPTRFGETGEYLIFLHKAGTSPTARWTTLAAYRVQYQPYSLGGLPGLEASSVIGLLATGTAPAFPPSKPAVTVTEAVRWLGRLALGQPAARRDETRMNAFFRASLLSAEASLSLGAPAHGENLAVAQKLADAVPLGMTRAQVGRIFPQRDGGMVGSSRGRYYFGSEVMIDVPYDTNGGPFQPENKVTGPLRVYRSMMHYG